MKTVRDKNIVFNREKTEEKAKGLIIISNGHLGTASYKNRINIRRADLRCATQIAREAFAGCTNLRQVQFPILKGIGQYAFFNCTQLKELEFPKSLIRIGTGAFMDNKSLISVRFHQECPIQELSALTFYGCRGLQAVQFPKKLQSIGQKAFYKCQNLNDLELPLSIKYIGAEAFYGCNIKELELPEGLLEIGDGAFRKCREIEYVYLPDSLKKIGTWTFHGCTRLSVLEARHDPEEIGEWITNKGCTIRCPKGSRFESYAKKYGMTVEFV